MVLFFFSLTHHNVESWTTCSDVFRCDCVETSFRIIDICLPKDRKLSVLVRSRSRHVGLENFVVFLFGSKSTFSPVYQEISPLLSNFVPKLRNILKNTSKIDLWKSLPNSCKNSSVTVGSNNCAILDIFFIVWKSKSSSPKSWTSF